ncbi:hypothetical protein Hdeb2414_s0010g00354761 [Helianthus debilis subsp. tardiflorus]
MLTRLTPVVYNLSIIFINGFLYPIYYSFMDIFFVCGHSEAQIWHVDIFSPFGFIFSSFVNFSPSNSIFHTIRV